MKKAVWSVCVFLSSFAVLASEVDVLICEPALSQQSPLRCKGVRGDYTATFLERERNVTIPEIRTLSITCGNEGKIAGLYTGYFAQTGGIVTFGMGFVSKKEKDASYGTCRIDVLASLAFPKITQVSLELKKSQ